MIEIFNLVTQSLAQRAYVQQHTDSGFTSFNPQNRVLLNRISSGG